jgi:hypothetical protein
MHYGGPQNTNYTMIDDLPDVSQIENHVPPGMAQQYNKYIRQSNRNMPTQSGMNSMNNMNNMNSMQIQDAMNSETQNYSDQMSSDDTMPQSKSTEYIGINNYNSPTCLEVCNHIDKCRLCSRFYNRDNTIYIIVIIVLTIICLLLLKKVLNI